MLIPDLDDELHMVSEIVSIGALSGKNWIPRCEAPRQATLFVRFA